ncbi:WbqC family protein [Anoxybacteroides amylolyticum]|uniref:WbqC family protein n=1 Tax=Anoxybacteroides amylolyticum TaxID=294699 RepID=UPI0008330ECF|nr:WbqC family protein [Anoxybacillus amylolyticus]
MKIAIMQPYLFPYIGYFQLIHTVDVFVLYDDVQFIKKGWIHRNRLLVNDKDYLFTLSLQKSPRETIIKEKFFSDQFDYEKGKLLQLIEHSYRKAPFFNEVYPLIQHIISHQDRNVCSFIYQSLVAICGYLEIKTRFIFSSEINKNNALKGQEKIIEINKLLKSDCYINPIGGTELYSKARFREEGLELYFLKPKLIQYKQFGAEFIPWLSIIDVLMFNSKDIVKNFLNEYQLI